MAGLDPARPLLDRYGTRSFKLTRDDAHTVQVIHTNAGMLGEEPQIGHADFCVNGGRVQPSCRGTRLREYAAKRRYTAAQRLSRAKEYPHSLAAAGERLDT